MATAPRGQGNRADLSQINRGLGAGGADDDDLDGDITITVGEEEGLNGYALKGLRRLRDGTLVADYGDADDDGEAVKPKDTAFEANLAEDMDESALSAIGQDILEGIRADEMTRARQVSTYTDNMDMMGLVIEKESGAGSVSRVRHPVLLESVVKFQSGALAELLPAAGPVKVENDGGESTDEDVQANAFQKDFNHYLTVDATEYYPDTDRMFFYLGYGGCTFKKVYRCPIRQRPVSEAIQLPDFIVSNDTTDIQNALRATHVLRYRKSEVMRMQLLGVWRECSLSSPVSQPNQAQYKEGQISGVQPQAPRPQDAMRVVYETYTELDLEEHGAGRQKGAPKGMPIPYRVTMDRESQQVLEIRRDWRKGDKLFKRRKHFVKFGLVPGFGFYDLGFLHLIGNQTKALTAIWRILVDAGMFNNFPGGVMNDALRVSTNVIRPGPGEFVPIKVGAGQDIQKAFYPLPYKEPSSVLLQLAEVIGEDANRMGSAVSIEVGEGRTNVPVGTIMAQIEQATQVMQAVHKRLHRAQAEELQLLRELFMEDPTALWRHSNKDPERKWKTAAEFANLDLTPASDPNVPSSIHRIMLAVALTMLASQNSSLYDQQAVHRRVLSMINIPNPDELLMTPEKAQAMPQQPPDPKIVVESMRQQGKTIDAQRETAQDQSQLQQAALTAGAKLQERHAEAQESAADRQSRDRIAAAREETTRLKLHADAAGDARDHQLERERMGHEQKMAQADHALEHQKAQNDQALAAQDHQMKREGQAHDQALAAKAQQTTDRKTDHDIETGRAETAATLTQPTGGGLGAPLT